MNRRHTLLAAMLICFLPATTRALDLTTIDRSIKKEPTYQTQPRYCLLVFGKEAKTHMWLVVDGRRLYVDRNGNGDLTEPGELIKSTNLFEGTSSLSPVNIDRLFRVDQIRETDGTVHKDFNLRVYDDERFGCSIDLAGGRSQTVGARTTESHPRLATRPQDAPIIHFNGPMTFARYEPIGIMSRASMQSSTLTPQPNGRAATCGIRAPIQS